MDWQQLWLAFLLPMTVSGRALGPTEKEAVLVSPLGKGGLRAWEGQGYPHYNLPWAFLLPSNLPACPYLLCILIYVAHLPLLSSSPPRPPLRHTVLLCPFPQNWPVSSFGLFETWSHYVSLPGLELAV